MQVSVLRNLLASEVTEMDLGMIVDDIRNNQKLFDKTNEYRQILTSGLKDDILKFKRKHFQAFAPNALLFDGKARDNVIGLTDLCFLDIDHINDSTQLDHAMALLRKDKHVVLAYKSVSGNGIHILIRYKVNGWNYPPNRTQMNAEAMQNRYKQVFDRLTNEYQKNLQLPIDKQTNNIECMCLISSDLDAYYNPDAEQLMLAL